MFVVLEAAPSFLFHYFKLLIISFTACGPPPDVDNAKVLPGNTKIGSIREYKCLGGLIPDKDPVVKCLPNAQWSNVTFMCVGKLLFVT